MAWRNCDCISNYKRHEGFFSCNAAWKEAFSMIFRENVKQKKSFAATVLWSIKGVWWESNPWPPEPQPGALPTELQTPYIAFERVKMNRQTSKPFLLSLYHRAIFCSGGRTRTYEVNRQWIYSPPSLPLEHSRIFSWSLMESNHVLRIFSPAHTPRLPKLQFCDEDGSRTHNLMLRRQLLWSNWATSPFAEAEGFEPSEPCGSAR